MARVVYVPVYPEMGFEALKRLAELLRSIKDLESNDRLLMRQR